MPIIVNLDVMLARRKMRSKELAERIGITEQNVSLLKSGKVKGVRFDTLALICEALDCQQSIGKSFCGQWLLKINPFREELPQALSIRFFHRGNKVARYN